MSEEEAESLAERYRRPSQVTDWLFIFATIGMAAFAYVQQAYVGQLSVLWFLMLGAKVFEPVLFAVLSRPNR